MLFWQQWMNEWMNEWMNGVCGVCKCCAVFTCPGSAHSHKWEMGLVRTHWYFHLSLPWIPLCPLPDPQKAAWFGGKNVSLGTVRYGFLSWLLRSCSVSLGKFLNNSDSYCVLNFPCGCGSRIHGAEEGTNDRRHMKYLKTALENVPFFSFFPFKSSLPMLGIHKLSLN